MRWSLYRTLSLRYLQRRWSRAALVVASIALGVATLVATRALNLSIQAAAQTASRPLAGMADFHVGNGDVGVRQELAAELARVPGVQNVTPLLIERVVVPELGNRPALLIGVEPPTPDLRENPWGLEYHVSDPLGLVLQGKRAIFVGKELASEWDQANPEGAKTFRIMAGGEEHTLPRWVGTVEARGAAASLGGHVLYMLDATAAAELMGRPGLVSRLDVTLEPDADRERTRLQLEEALQGKALLRTPEAHDQSIHDAMAGLQIGFSLCGAGALVVGLFLVYNALAVSVAERRHEIGILRSVGATRGQIWGLFVGEAGLLGLAGAGLGMPLGVFFARLGLAPMNEVFSDLFRALETRAVLVTPGTLLVSSAAGIVTALVAALLPAVRAARQAPADAVRGSPPVAGVAHFVLQGASSGLLMAAGAACMIFRDYLPPRSGTYGCLVLILLGLLLLIPLLAALLAGMIRPLLRQFLGIESRLAADNLLRSPGRTGLVITALAAGVALVLQTAGVIRSNKSVILEWVDQSILADLFVTSGSPVSGSGQNVPLKATVGERLAADPGVAAVLPVRFRQVDFRDSKVFLVAVDARVYYETAKTRSPREELELYPRLCDPGPPAVIVSENFAALHGIGTGETFAVRGPNGPVELRVIGTLVDYSWNRGTVIIDHSPYREHFHDSLVDVFDVFLRPEADRDALRETWGAKHGLVVLTRDELQNRIRGIIERLYEIAYAQEMVVGLVAALGVVTALLVSVLQRRGEIGVLRALGATRGQVLRSVLAEAVLMGSIGTLIGLLLGIPIEWYILRFVLFEESGFHFAMSIPWTEAVVIAVLAVTLATLSGLIPALHTLRIRIPEAIAYE